MLSAQLQIVCRRCKHWYIYEKQDVKWREFLQPLERQTDLAFWRVELECGQSNCESRTQWHTLVDSALAPDEVRAVVNSGEPPISCANHHPLVVAETKILQVNGVFEV